jgi:hypothetical protein
MSQEPTVIRRYTPPTCTLEIAAQQSPLSRWMGKIALKDLRFKLSFDDPRVSDDRWLTLRGDRDQLEAVAETVNSYVQSFLSQSNSPTGGGTLLAEPTTKTTTGIALHPKGLLSHQLSLGTLATEESGESVVLSSTQLADLATALDEYAAEATTIPKLERPTWITQPQNWTAIAAGLLVTVGVSTSVLKGLDKSSPSTANAPTASSSDQRLAVQPPTNPTPSLPTLGNSPLANLPPGVMPPIGNSTTPGQPNIVAASPLPSPSPNPSLNPSAKTTDVPTIANGQAGATAGAQPEVVEIPKPATPQIKEVPSTADVPAIAAARVAPIPPTDASNGDLVAKQRALESTADDLKNAPEPEPPGKRRFEQAAALRQRVQEGWQKPEKPLSGSIEYRVMINPDGSLGSVTPLTDQAANVLGSSGIPAQGSQVAPSSDDGKASTIRLNLGADGVVNAVPE